MKSLNVILSNDNRSIEVTYKVIDEEYDSNTFHKIMEIVRKNDLSCVASKATNVRCFHISGITSTEVLKAYKEVEKLS